MLQQLTQHGTHRIEIRRRHFNPRPAGQSNRQRHVDRRNPHRLERGRVVAIANRRCKTFQPSSPNLRTAEPVAATQRLYQNLKIEP